MSCERECAAFVSLSQPAGPLSCSGSGNGSSRHSSVRRPTLSAATLTDDGGAGWACVCAVTLDGGSYQSETAAGEQGARR